MHFDDDLEKENLRPPMRYATCTSCLFYSEEEGNWSGTTPVCLNPKKDYPIESYAKIHRGNQLCHTLPSRCTSALSCPRYRYNHAYKVVWGVSSDERFYRQEGARYLRNLGYLPIDSRDGKVVETRTICEIPR